jgi:hypothetical protein
MRKVTEFKMLSVLVAVFYLPACGPADTRTNAEKQADSSSMSVLASFASKGITMTSLDAQQRVFVDSLLPVYTKLSSEDQIYAATFEKAKLTPKGLTLQQFLSNPAAAGTDFTTDASFVRIKNAARAQLGIGLTPTSTSVSDDSPTRQAITAAIDCLAVVVIAIIVGLVVVAVASIQGNTSVEFCNNCNMAAATACTMLMKEAKVRCTADGMISGSGAFDSKDGPVSKADGATRTGYTCEWQCL